MVKFIKNFWSTCALLTALGLLGYPAFAESYPPTDGAMSGFVLLKERTPAPETSFTNESGNAVQMSDFRGKVVLVNFWATWCAPCIHEMPSLDRLQADLGGDDFVVVAINQDIKGRKKAEPMLRDKLDLHNLDLFLDPKLKLGRAFNIQGMPATFAIDRQGRIVGAYTGPAEWDSDDAKSLVQYLIEE